MEQIFLNGLNLLVSVVSTVFKVVFFWLPEDPFTQLVENWDVVSAANAQAIRWLNWFVDVPFISSVFAAFVAVFLCFAAWKVIMMILSVTFKAVESVPLVE